MEVYDSLVVLHSQWKRLVGVVFGEWLFALLEQRRNSPAGVPKMAGPKMDPICHDPCCKDSPKRAATFFGNPVVCFCQSPYDPTQSSNRMLSDPKTPQGQSEEAPPYGTCLNLGVFLVSYEF